MAEKQHYDAFLSYSFKDKRWVSEFVTALREAGCKAFFDVSDLTPGDRWKDKTQEALRDSSILIVILSPNSLESSWTFFELGAAVADNKKIIPIIIQDIDLKRVPTLLWQFQFLKESSPTEAGKRVARVLERVEAKPEQR